MPIHRTLRLLPALAVLGACGLTDSPTTPRDRTPPDTPLPLGVYELRITGLGLESEQMRSTITPVPAVAGASRTLTPLGSGIAFEQIASSSFTEGARGQGGQRYVSFTYRVRNGTAAPISNLTLLMVSRAGVVGGTPVSSIRRFDNTLADSNIARQIVPTGAVAMDADGITMRALYADVMQAYSEAEIAAITPPAGVTNIFPYGYVVRNPATAGSRTLPVAVDGNDFDGILTLSFRLPLQSAATLDVFSFSFQILAVSDSEVRVTESIEEQAGLGPFQVAQVASLLAATRVTVLAGSGSAGYTGQQQICLLRTAGTAASPITRVTAPGAFTRLAIYQPGDSVDGCAVNYRTGSANTLAIGVPAAMAVRAMDRYGNTITTAVDSVAMSSDDLGMTSTPRSALVGGLKTMMVTFSQPGNRPLTATGRRLSTTRTAHINP